MTKKPHAVVDTDSNNSMNQTMNQSFPVQMDRRSVGPSDSHKVTPSSIFVIEDRESDNTSVINMEEDDGSFFDKSDMEENENVYEKIVNKGANKITGELSHKYVAENMRNVSDEVSDSDGESRGPIDLSSDQHAGDTTDEVSEETKDETSSGSDAENMDIDNERIDDNSSDHDNVETNIGKSGKVFSSRMLPLTVPLILKQNVTAKDHLLAIIAICMRYKSSYEMMLTMMKWIDSTVEYSKLPKSKNALWSILSRNVSAAKRHLYCFDCRACIGVGRTIERECNCEACGPKKSEKKVSYFVEISIQTQLEELFAIPGIANDLNYRFTRQKKDPDAIEDIYDGEKYKQLCQPGGFLANPMNFSFTLNSDGASVADSSTASAWPIYLQINELHPHVRKKHDASRYMGR